MPINLFPARVPIGRVTDSTGKEHDVLMTVEFSRALADVLQRIGGANGLGSDDLAVMSALFESPSPPNDATAAVSAAAQDSVMGAITSLRQEVDMLRQEVAAAVAPAATVQKIEDLFVMLNMAKEPAALTKNTATGSRGANAALASLLTALASSGLVIDSTTV